MLSNKNVRVDLTYVQMTRCVVIEVQRDVYVTSKGRESLILWEESVPTTTHTHLKHAKVQGLKKHFAVLPQLPGQLDISRWTTRMHPEEAHKWSGANFTGRVTVNLPKHHECWVYMNKRLVLGKTCERVNVSEDEHML